VTRIGRPFSFGVIVASVSSIISGIEPMGLAEDSDDNFVLSASSGGSTSSGDPDLEALHHELGNDDLCH